MICVKKISKSYGSRTLWSDLSFGLEKGEMKAVVGPSGSGKSTLLNCLGTLETVDSGEILVDGKDVVKYGSRSQRRFRRDTLGYLFQNYALIENASVSFNLRVAMTRADGRGRSHDICEAALRRVGLAGRSNEMVYRLSGGEQQRVALARLLVKRPTLVVADEPTGAVDTENAKMVIGALREMAGNGCAIIIATHSKIVQDNCDSSLDLGACR
ncbi:ATP-binding cassette domain-containing protein [Micromonospora sp. WMMD708]|uniref:ATP-binding cassette domain-containing protein n=1 Tax=Micromonospora sp. WMMD708 TaxID=3403464 RepID=UPI003BF5AF16